MFDFWRPLPPTPAGEGGLGRGGEGEGPPNIDRKLIEISLNLIRVPAVRNFGAHGSLVNSRTCPSPALHILGRSTKAQPVCKTEHCLYWTWMVSPLEHLVQRSLVFQLPAFGAASSNENQEAPTHRPRKCHNKLSGGPPWDGLWVSLRWKWDR